MDTTRSHYDCLIAGAGPAGIFAALELVRRNGSSVLLLEQGPDIDRRTCPARTTGVCANCSPCDVTCGWGGAGAFSDGKLTLSPEVGGWLGEFVPADTLTALVSYVDDVWLEYGAPREVHGAMSPSVEAIRRQALVHGMTLITSPVRHMGSDRAADILRAMRADLEPRVAVRTGTTVESITVRDGVATGVTCTDGSSYSADAVVVAPGRQGASWLVDECHRLGIAVRTNPVDIGVRAEVPAVVMEPLTSVLYESKLVSYARTFDDPVRTFCMNPHGVVSVENYGDVVTVNGHSYADRKTEYTNFALLVSTDFTQPFDDPITYGKSIARLANLLGDDIIVQRLGDLLSGHRSTAERLAPQHGATDARRRHAGRSVLRAALPPPARHPRHARGTRRACPRRECSRYTALRHRGQVLLGAAPARPRAADRDREPVRDRRRRRRHQGPRPGERVGRARRPVHPRRRS